MEILIGIFLLIILLIINIVLLIANNFEEFIEYIEKRRRHDNGRD